MKKLTLDQIKSGSLVGQPEFVTIPLEVDNEKVEFDTYIKPFSYATAVGRMEAYVENKAALAGIIAGSLYTKEVIEVKGEEDQILFKPTFTADEVRENFTEPMTDAIWAKIVEINGLGKPKPNSTQTQNSSVKSESQQGEVSKKSKTLTTQK